MRGERGEGKGEGMKGRREGEGDERRERRERGRGGGREEGRGGEGVNTCINFQSQQLTCNQFSISTVLIPSVSASLTLDI